MVCEMQVDCDVVDTWLVVRMKTVRWRKALAILDGSHVRQGEAHRYLHSY
jgi:hypothetical protein